MCREWETERERFPRHSRGKWTARCSFFLPLEYLYGTVAAAAAALPSSTADNKSTPREEYTSPVAVVDAFAAVAAFGVLQTFAPLLFHFHGTPIWRNFLWRPRLSQSVGGAIQKFVFQIFFWEIHSSTVAGASSSSCCCCWRKKLIWTKIWSFLIYFVLSYLLLCRPSLRYMPRSSSASSESFECPQQALGSNILLGSPFNLNWSEFT